MDTNKMREQFKSALHSQKEFKLTAEAIAAAEWAWKASREAVVVKLPAERRIRHAPMPDENGSYNEALENCREAIEAQGLKVEVKP